jgi:hypothetical protein
MSWMDLCGISNLRWDSNPRYSAFPIVDCKDEAGNMQRNETLCDIETQSVSFPKLDWSQGRLMQAGQRENPLETEIHKSASPSTSAPPGRNLA